MFATGKPMSSVALAAVAANSRAKFVPFRTCTSENRGELTVNLWVSRANECLSGVLARPYVSYARSAALNSISVSGVPDWS